MLDSKINKPEPMPEINDYPAVWDLVIKDMQERDKSGQEKYNTRLQPFNGRNALIDAYQETLDLVVYLRQKIYELQNAQKKYFIFYTCDDEGPHWIRLICAKNKIDALMSIPNIIENHFGKYPSSPDLQTEYYQNILDFICSEDNYMDGDSQSLIVLNEIEMIDQN